MLNVDYSKAYSYIRERILSGEFPSGQPLRPNDLAVAIGISRTPVRDALRQLDADGLVSVRPRLGASVRVVEVDELREISELRMALEIFAVGLAAQKRTEDELKVIEAAHEAIGVEIERLIAETELKSNLLQTLTSGHLVKEEWILHVAIISAAKNQLIKKEILRHHLINRVVGMYTGGHLDVPSPSNRAEAVAFLRSTYNEHKEICEAIKRKDPIAARHAMELHLQLGVDSMLRRMARGEVGQIVGQFAKSAFDPAATRDP